MVYRLLARRLEGEAVRSPRAREALVELNTAYWVLSDPVRRAAYDHEVANAGGSEHEAAELPDGTPVDEEAPPSRGVASEEAPGFAADQVTFGRYAGWTLRQILRHDPEYLVWLQRHSSGMRYRRQIEVLLREARMP
jgi:curved DNA-binding protein CbpA